MFHDRDSKRDSSNLNKSTARLSGVHARAKIRAYSSDTLNSLPFLALSHTDKVFQLRCEAI